MESSGSSFCLCGVICSKSLLIFFTGLIYWCTFVHSAFHVPKDIKFSALLVFGDSIVDPGNNNYVSTPAKANYPPYGQDFAGRVPTGRFSDGLVPSDLIAQALSIKKLLPAYLDPNLKPSDLPTGVSFASGGAGYDPLSSVLGVATPLSGQLNHFREYKTRLTSLVGKNASSQIISRSVFLVVASSNDIATTYFASRLRTPQYNIQSYTTLLANSAGDFVKELYKEGARWIALFSAPPLGCLPSQRTIAGGKERECVESYNQAAMLFNSKLSSVVYKFTKRNTDAQATVIDIYKPLLELIQKPEQNGFKVADKGCCGSGKIEVTFLCSQSAINSVKTCSDPTKYVFWDSFHPTEATYRLLVSKIFSEYF